MRAASRPIIGVAILAIATSACAADGANAPSGGAELDGPVLSLDLPAEDDAEAVDAFGREMDRRLAHHARGAAGMDDALGDAAAETFEQLDSSREGLVQEAVQAVAFSAARSIVLASRTPPVEPRRPAAPAIRSAQTSFLVAMTPGGLADDVLSSEGEDFRPDETRIEVGDASASLTLTRTQAVADGALSVDVTLTTTVALPDPPGGSITETYTGNVTVPVCPSETGSVLATIELTLRSKLSQSSAGTRDGETTIAGDVTASVDDEANLASADYRLRATSRATAAPGDGQAEGVYGEVSVEVRAESGPDGSSFGVPTGRTIHKSSRATDDALSSLADTALNQGTWVLSSALQEVEQLWRSGYCVEVRVLEPEGDQSDVAPGSEHPIVAQARHRRDRVDIDAPIEAELISGERSVSPSGERLPSPAHFTFTAAPERSSGGRVRLRSVSRRGIGEVEIHFGTGGLTAWRVEATRTETWEALADTLITASGTATEVTADGGLVEGEGTYTESRYAGDFCPGRGDDPEAVREASGVALIMVVVTPDGLIALISTPDGRSLIGIDDVKYIPPEGGTVTSTQEVAPGQSLHCGGRGTIETSITVTPVGD